MKKFIPLARPSLPNLKSISRGLAQILKSGMITEHKFVGLFEKRCAEFLKVSHAIVTSNGTSALILTLKSLRLKGEVIIPSFTYTSDAHALLWCGLTPVFADINPRTYNLDPAVVEKKITKNTAAIMPTHVFGNPCDISKFEKLRAKYGVKIIYDAAHAFGSTYNNKSVASFGDAVVYSLTPTKVFTTGEGGLIATNNKSLAARLRLAKFNGDSFNRSEEFLGMTSRLTEFQAILGLANLERFPADLKKRLARAAYYKNKLSKIKGIIFQRIEDVATSVYKDLTIVIDPKKSGFSRDKLFKEFEKNRIQTKIYFYPVLHKKKVYQSYKDTYLPHTGYISKQIINLPLYSNMSFNYIDRVCEVVIRTSKNKY